MKNKENKKLKLQLIDCIEACDEEFGSHTEQYKKVLKQVKNSVIFTNPKHSVDENLNYPILPFEDYIFDALMVMYYTFEGNSEVALISPNYKEWAIKFEEYLKTIENDELQKSEDADNIVMFYYDNASINFINYAVKDQPGYSIIGLVDGRLTFSR